MCPTLIRHLGITTTSLNDPVHPCALTGAPLDEVRLVTTPVKLLMSGNHHEELAFLVMRSPRTPLVLGRPWLQQHNPQIDWALGTITGWSPSCHAICLWSATCLTLPPQTNRPTPDLSAIPPVYHDLGEVFSKDRATSLPPHRSYDCTINLLPGSSPPRGRLYSLSAPEHLAMEKYIGESLASSSPAGAGLFFVGKKDSSLCSCIDYRGLNDITTATWFHSSPPPLPHSRRPSTSPNWICGMPTTWSASGREMSGRRHSTPPVDTMSTGWCCLVSPMHLQSSRPSLMMSSVMSLIVTASPTETISWFSRRPLTNCHVLQWLQENRLFAKAEKCEFHRSTVQFLGFVFSMGRLEMDPAKTEAVTLWPTPAGRRELQRFLGFANFYRQSIRNYSSVVQPLTALTSTKVPFLWTLEAKAAFSALKTRFATAPVLIMANPERQFVLEVDASDTRVGTLSQRGGGDNKMHPCTFFSHHLSPAEQNYPIDRELLALALEWLHLLEGSVVPFLVWTDHRNLEYLRTAKLLNPRQARWSLFFIRFPFSLSYRLGSKNVKPDALSHLHSPSQSSEVPTTVLPAKTLVTAIHLHFGEGFGGHHCSRQLPGRTALRAWSSPVQGSYVGPFFSTRLSPWGPPHPGPPGSPLLVAVSPPRHNGVCLGLQRLRPRVARCAPRVSFSHCLCLIALGPTSPSISDRGKSKNSHRAMFFLAAVATENSKSEIQGSRGVCACLSWRYPTPCCHGNCAHRPKWLFHNH